MVAQWQQERPGPKGVPSFHRDGKALRVRPDKYNDIVCFLLFGL